MIVVSNTTPLIGLASIQRFQLLEQLFGEIHIPQAVYEEAVVAGREVGGARREVLAATWIKTLSVKDRLAVDMLLGELDSGEAETIVLAREIHRICLYARCHSREAARWAHNPEVPGSNPGPAT